MCSETPESIIHVPELKIERQFPIYLSTVPATASIFIPDNSSVDFYFAI